MLVLEAANDILVADADAVVIVTGSVGDHLLLWRRRRRRRRVESKRILACERQQRSRRSIGRDELNEGGVSTAMASGERLPLSLSALCCKLAAVTTAERLEQSTKRAGNQHVGRRPADMAVITAPTD